MKKRNLVIISIIVAAITGLFIIDNKLKKDINNIESKLDYGYEFYCTDEFLNLLNKDTNNVFSTYQNKKQIIGMLDDNSCYKHNENVPSIYIFTKDNNGLNLKKTDGYIDTQIVFVDNDNYINDYDSKIKVRGNSTSEAAKKPYNIKFNEKQDLLGFGKAKKWNLLAECFDPTLIRNNLFLGLAYKLGLENTSKSQYVELYIDQIYMGCYLLTEAVEVGENRVDIDVDNGDFLIEYEKEKDEADATYVTTKHNIRFVLSDPEEPNEDQLQQITAIINQFDDCLFSDNYVELEKNLDIDSFVKVYLLNEFAKTVDFGYSSVYFYYKDKKIYAGPVWDFDMSSGNSNKKEKNGYWVIENNEDISYSDFWCSKQNLVYKQLLTYPKVYEKYLKMLEEYTYLFESVYMDNGIIDNLLNDYIWLYEKNYQNIQNGGAGWDVKTRYGGSEGDRFETYQENVDFLKEWIKNRLEWLTNNS